MEIDVADQPTCGQGLAEHALLPKKFGELLAAVAENLEVHMKALDLTDANAAEEHRVYRKLADEHRAVAAQLQGIAEAMSAQSDLPMGRHDERAMTSAEVLAAFEAFVRAEQHLLAVLQKRVDQDQAMLRDTRRAVTT